MAIGVERRAKKVNTRLDHALLLQPVSNAMAFDPLAQPTGTSFPVPETPTLQSSEGDTEYNTASSGQAVEPTSQRQGGKKRRPSKDKSSSALRRSSSTPHMRNLALGTAGDLSPTGDKRRNKLGYHRTSVACGKPCVTPACGALADFTETGHCRRRKIRCLVANDETTGRCANCIRLKKECNFYPVDQNPEPPRQGAGKDSVAGLHRATLRQLREIGQRTSALRTPTQFLVIQQQDTQYQASRKPHPNTVNRHMDVSTVAGPEGLGC
jgi:hypothetical protein